MAKEKKRVTLLLDLDGVLIRRWQKKPSMANQEALSGIFSLLSNFNPYPRIIFLTDRPAGQLPYFVWAFRGDRYHGGELGSVVYDRNTYRTFIAPDYQEFSEAIRPKIIKRLCRKFQLDVSFSGPCQEIGGKLVTISMEVPLAAQHNFSKETVDRALTAFRNDIYVEGGSAISVYPKKLNKLEGLKVLEKLYKDAGEPLDLSKTVWIADGDRDIPIVDYLKEKKGLSAAVGNATAEFRKKVEECHGVIISEKYPYEAGLLLILKNLF